MALKDRFRHIDSNGTYDSVADISQFEALVVELLDSSTDGFAIGSLVCTTLYGMLTIDKRVVLFATLVGVREGNLNILILDMNNRIERIHSHRLG